MNSKNIFIWLCLTIYSELCFGKLFILTTISDLEAVAKEIGGEEVVVESFCKGSQDPHFLEAKPSYMMKVNKADLVLAVGLGLEDGWLPKVLSGGRNSKVMPGQQGFLAVGQLVDVLDIPTGSISRADGDVHPQGNPHVTLDPIRLGSIAEGIAKRLAELEPNHGRIFIQRAKELKERLEEKTKNWQQRIVKSGIKQVITYHKTLNYFLSRFDLPILATLEPLPGVAPTAAHILEVINKAKANGSRLILVENFFDDAPAHRVAKEVEGMRVASVPVAVGGNTNVRSVDELFEYLVGLIEGK